MKIRIKWISRKCREMMIVIGGLDIRCRIIDETVNSDGSISYVAKMMNNLVRIDRKVRGDERVMWNEYVLCSSKDNVTLNVLMVNC